MSGFEYSVEQGDCLSSIASRFGLPDWRTIYDHPNNAEHRRKRPNPNILLPGDRLFIPHEAAHASANTDQRHQFRLPGSNTRLRLVIKDNADRPIANRPYRINVGERMFDGITDAAGQIDRKIAATATGGELLLRGPAGSDASADRVWPLRIGHLDPVETVTGIQARLNNLGFDAGVVDGVVGPRTRMAICLFQRRYDLFVDGIAGAQTRGKLRAVHGC